jgi:hypothetical protein
MPVRCFGGVLAFPAPTLWKDCRAMTAPEDGLFRQAVALAPATVLRSLAEAAGADGWPEVSVYLSSGQVLGGVPVRTGEDRGQDVVVLADARTGQVGYALLANVIAVEVRAPERVRDVLTGGRLAPPVSGVPVTKLALRREFPPSPEFPLHVDWAAVPDSAVALANLDRLLRGLREVAGEVRADEVGRRAWAPVRAVSVAHLAGARPMVEAAPDGLAVRADLTAALPRDVAGELRRQVNALL